MRAKQAMVGLMCDDVVGCGLSCDGRQDRLRDFRGLTPNFIVGCLPNMTCMVMILISPLPLSSLLPPLNALED